MLYTHVSQLRFPGAVPALLAWTEGDTEELALRAQAFRDEVPRILENLKTALNIAAVRSVCQAANDLCRRIAPLGVPHIFATVAMVEDLARGNNLGPVLPLIDELEQTLAAFCGFLAKKPWIS